MRGCPRNPNKGKATESRSQTGGETPPLLAANTAEPPDAPHMRGPYVASDVPHYSSPGSHVDGGASISNQLVPAPALVPGSAPRKTLISSAQGTATSNSNEEILRTDLQPSAVVWEGVPSLSAQGHVDDTATSFPFIDNDTSSSRRYQAPVQPTMQLRGYQDASMAQTSKGSHFYRDPDNFSSEEATVPSSADVTTYMVTSFDSSAGYVANKIRLKANCTIKPLRVSFNDGSCARRLARGSAPRQCDARPCRAAASTIPWAFVLRRAAKRGREFFGGP